METTLGVFAANAGDEFFHAGLNEELGFLLNGETEQYALQIRWIDFRVSAKLRRHILLYTCKAFAPNVIELYRSFHVSQAVLGHFTIETGFDEGAHVGPGDA